jgi:hypothetical protein
MPQNTNSSLIGRLLSIVIAVAFPLFLLCICEIILRLFFQLYFTGYIGAYQYDKKLGYRLKDGIHFLKTTDYQQEILTNKLGTVNFQEKFDGYKKIVFAVGDSFTQGTGLPADASYPFQLDLLLNLDNDRYIKEYAVINLGLAAFGGRQNLIALKRYAERLGKPNFILYLGCGNDYEDDVLFESGYTYKHMVAGNPYWGWYLRPMMWLTNELEIGKRLKIIVADLRRQRIFSAEEQMGVPNNDKKAMKKNVAELEAPVLQELIQISQDYGGKLIVSWTDSPIRSEGSYQWLQAYARKHHIAFADWHPAVAAVLHSIPGLPLNNPHSGSHYRTWVNGQIARAYARQILASP